MNFINCKFHVLVAFLTISLGCNSDNGEFPSYGELRATINGEIITFNAGKAKVYAGTDGALSVFGSNCSEGRKYIRLDVPFSEGAYDYSEGTLPGASYYTHAAFACPDGSGTSTKRIVREARVTVAMLSDTRIEGTFEMMAGNPSIDDIDVIADGYFNVTLE